MANIQLRNNEANVFPIVNIQQFNLPPSGTVTLNHDGMVLVICDRGGMWTEGTASRVLDEIKSSQYVTVTRTDSNNLSIQNNLNYYSAIFVISDKYFKFV